MSEIEPRGDASQSKFIRLHGGMTYINSEEITEIRWLPTPGEPYETPPPNSHYLAVYYTNRQMSTFAGDDAMLVMRALGLPEETPRRE